MHGDAGLENELLWEAGATAAWREMLSASSRDYLVAHRVGGDSTRCDGRVKAVAPGQSKGEKDEADTIEGGALLSGRSPVGVWFDMMKGSKEHPKHECI